MLSHKAYYFCHKLISVSIAESFITIAAISDYADYTPSLTQTGYGQLTARWTLIG